MRLATAIERTDEDLARAARAGGSGSFDELVRRYQVPLLRFLQRRLPKQIDPEDVIQDAFLRVHQSISSYRDGEPFEPWIYTIAYRVAIDSARRPRPTSVSMMETLTDHHDDGPLSRASRRDSGDYLWSLVRRVLDDEPFTAVWLYYGEGMATADIARITSRSQAWVKTTLLRARAKIKDALEQCK